MVNQNAQSASKWSERKTWVIIWGYILARSHLPVHIVTTGLINPATWNHMSLEYTERKCNKNVQIIMHKIKLNKEFIYWHFRESLSVSSASLINWNGNTCTKKSWLFQDNFPLEVGKSKCSICFKMIKGKNMNRHLRLHTGEKEYACQYCDYRSNQFSNLKSHVFRVHGEKIYKWCTNNHA